MCRITFRQETVKRMKEELEKAYVDVEATNKPCDDCRY